jgi:hypothetical protein
MGRAAQHVWAARVQSVSRHGSERGGEETTDYTQYRLETTD